MDYKILDTGNGMKLEQVGEYRLARPAMNAFWEPTLSEKEWNNVNGIFTRDSKGSGTWQWKKGGVPESWVINFADVNIIVKPTNFGHLGFFAEHLKSWNWVKKYIENATEQVNILNLFAYSGVGSLSMAKAGAKVCHLDAAKGMIQWGRESLEQNPDIPSTIRWIADDVIKFLNREIRRENKYNGIIMDPPSFGRGAQGQVWKMEENVNELLELCAQVVDTTKPYFIILSCHTPGFSPIVLERLLLQKFKGNSKVTSGEMTMTEENELMIPAGNYARIEITP